MSPVMHTREDGFPEHSVPADQRWWQWGKRRDSSSGELGSQGPVKEQQSR